MVVLYIFSASFMDEGMRLNQCGECLVFSEGIDWFRTLSIFIYTFFVEPMVVRVLHITK